MRNFDIKEFHANNDGAGYYKRVLSNVSIEKRSLHDVDRNIVGYIEVCEDLYTPTITIMSMISVVTYAVV